MISTSFFTFYDIYCFVHFADRFLTQKSSAVTFVKEPFQNNTKVVDRLMSSIKSTIESKNHTADDLRK